MSSNDGTEQDAELADGGKLVAPELPAQQKKAPSPRNCREFVRRETANAMRDIVNNFVKQAKDGSVPHFTSLTKVSGFDKQDLPPKAPKSRRKSLARQLLDEVERYEAKQAARLATASTSLTGRGESNGEPKEVS